MAVPYNPICQPEYREDPAITVARIKAASEIVRIRFHEENGNPLLSEVVKRASDYLIEQFGSVEDFNIPELPPYEG